MGKPRWVRRGNILYDLAGAEHVETVWATTDDACFHASGPANDGSHFEASWSRSECLPDGTIVGMLGYRVQLEGAKPAMGHCKRPGCGQLFFGARSDKDYCGLDDGEGAQKGKCFKAYQSERQRLRRLKENPRQQVTA